MSKLTNDSGYITAVQAPVQSVNNKTGAVQLNASDVGALPADTVIPTVNNATLTIKRNSIDVGSFTSNAANDVNIDINVPTNKSDIGLGNVDNVKQYSATNPPPYPVTSVNGATGEVKSTFYVAVTQGDDDSVTADKTAAEVYAAYAAGYAVYAIVKFSAVDFNLELPLVLAEHFFGTFILGFGALGSINPTENPQYPTVSYTGTKWLAWLGTLARASDIPEGVPSVTAADNGKFLRVVSGKWSAVEIANANGGSFSWLNI